MGVTNLVSRFFGSSEGLKGIERVGSFMGSEPKHAHILSQIRLFVYYSNIM